MCGRCSCRSCSSRTSRGAARWTWGPRSRSRVAALVVAPWVVRNEVERRLRALTTDARALWKANNEHTLETLRGGGWIDDVPSIPGAPITPQEAGALYQADGARRARRRVRADALLPLARARLHGATTRARRRSSRCMARSVLAAARDEDGRTSGVGHAARHRARLGEPLFASRLSSSRSRASCSCRGTSSGSLSLLAYQTLAAMVFVGQTRYRVPWDFLLAVPAAAALVALCERARRRPAT